ncbi:hypothetical protein LA080_000377 [Diaporthe eres]|nr:hypothetical protein LA080_000377 [Diaporthe eres]
MADGPHSNDQNGSGQNGIDKENGTHTNDTRTNDTHHNDTAAAQNATAARQCTCKFPRIHTDDDGKEIGTINKIMRNEFLYTSDGTKYSRRHVCDPNPNQWKEINKPVRPKTPPKEKTLWVVRQSQVEKNPHWSLFAAVDDDSDSPRGRVWQVNGDPDVGMFYAHRNSVPGVAIFISASFLDSILVCDALTEEWEARVDEIANTIKPPGPPETPTNGQGRKIDFQRKTCKNWVWDVLDRLAEEGITSPAVPAKARSLQPFVKAHE